MPKFKISHKYLIFFILTLILCLAAFLRFYRIREYMTFLGDEGRDMLVVKRMIVDHKLTLLGPITSVGSMYMGPIYYYMMAPFLFLWHLDPVGPSIMVVILSVATVFLVYLLGSGLFNPETGLIAALLYADSPLTILYGRASWNPNVVPFFSVLLIYSLFRVVEKKQYNWLLITGLNLGILIQLHYVTFMFFPIILFSLFLIRFRIPVKQYLLSAVFFIAAYSPFLLFELRHQFVNTMAVIRFVLGNPSSNHTPLIFSFINNLNDVSVRLFWRLIIPESAELTKIFLGLLIVFYIIYFRKFRRKNEYGSSFKLLFIWLGVGLLSFGLYKGPIYDYYFGLLFGVPFILTGFALSFLAWKIIYGKIIAALIIAILLFFSFKHSPLAIEPNNLLRNSEEIARFIYDKDNGQKYNFALISGHNSDHAYRYFLEIWGNPPVTIENEVIDPKRTTVTDQLFVVCEEKICQPLGHPLWEIAGFGRAEIAGQWKVVTATVFKLVHYKQN